MSDIEIIEDAPLPDEILNVQGKEAQTDETAKAVEETEISEADDESATQKDEADADEQDAQAVEEDTDSGDDSEGNEEGDEADPEPEKLSRNQRRTLKIQEQARLIAERDAEVAALREQLEKVQTSEGPKAPDEGDYDDYAKYESDVQAFNIKQAIQESRKEDRAEDLKAQIHARTEAQFEESKKGFSERETKASAKLPEYDTKITEMVNVLRASDAAIPVETLQEIYDDPMGPQILYMAATDPKRELLSDLVHLTPQRAAGLIGRLSGSLSAQTPKQKTTATKPITTPQGGGNAQPKPLAKQNYEEYKKSRGFG